jgi:hypothetical protein
MASPAATITQRARSCRCPRRRGRSLTLEQRDQPRRVDGLDPERRRGELASRVAFVSCSACVSIPTHLPRASDHRGQDRHSRAATRAAPSRR